MEVEEIFPYRSISQGRRTSINTTSGVPSFNFCCKSTTVMPLQTQRKHINFNMGVYSCLLKGEPVTKNLYFLYNTLGIVSRRSYAISKLVCLPYIILRCNSKHAESGSRRLAKYRNTLNDGSCIVKGFMDNYGGVYFIMETHFFNFVADKFFIFSEFHF